MRRYMQLRGGYESDEEQFFVFRDNNPVTPVHARNLLKMLLSQMNLDGRLYGMHSFRIGRTTDLLKFKYTVDEVNLMGRWKSNVIFRYIR